MKPQAIYDNLIKQLLINSQFQLSKDEKLIRRIAMRSRPFLLKSGRTTVSEQSNVCFPPKVSGIKQKQSV